MKSRKPAPKRRKPAPKPARRRVQRRKPARRPRRVIARPAIKRRSGIKYRAFLKPGEKLVARNRFGKIVKKPRSTVKYYFEIRDKKTNRVTGYVNRILKDRETGKYLVEPRKLKSSYYKFVKRPEVDEMPGMRPGYSQKFKVTHTKTVLRQVTGAAKKFVTTAFEYSKARKETVVKITMRHPVEGTFVKVVGIKQGTSYAEIAQAIGYTITENISAGRFRMSRKDMSDNPDANLVKTLEVQCEILQA